MSGLIRPAMLAEAELLPEIERSAGEAFRGSVHNWVADHDVTPADAYPPLIASGLVWVALDGEAPAGFVACEAFGDALHVWELAVHHDRQGRGLGRSLMRAAVEAAAARQLSVVTLTTFLNIPWNAPFYEGLGFRVIAAPEMPTRLSEVLSGEAARGLTDRCAMARRIA
jgi:ribosomal protein S18 acetylase RimI-like enzyme